MRKVDPRKLQALRSQQEAPPPGKEAADGPAPPGKGGADLQAQIQSVARRNEADMRMVQGVVGVVVGAVVGFAILARATRHHSHEVPGWCYLVVLLVGGVIGGVLGYCRATWRSGLD